VKTRRPIVAYARTLIALCAATLLVYAAGAAGADTPGNLLQNASLEQGSGNTPSCWLLGGYGTNSYQWTRTSDAHTGSYAEALNVSSLTNGDRKLLTAFSGNCSPTVTPGHTYTVTVSYKSSTRPAIFAFTRTSSSGFRWWAQSPRLATTLAWTQASWTTPVVPAGVTNLSVGLGLQVAGSVVMDDFSFVDATGSGGGSDTTPPTSTISCNGATCSTGYYNSSVNVSLSATDNSGGSGVSSIRYTTDGTTPTLTNGYAYGSPFVVGADMSIKYRAYDKSGNAGAVNTQAIRFDTTTPTVSLTTPARGATLTGLATFSATAGDNIAIDHVDFLVDGTKVGSAVSPPYSVTWESSAVTNGSHTVAARALDGAGNAATTSGVPVTVTNVAALPPPPGGHFSTLPSGAPGLPRGDSSCASQVTTSTWEPRSDNTTANHAVPSDPRAVPWSDAESGAYWSRWLAKRSLVTGNYRGTTNQIIQWAACKWGLDEDLLRAVAVQESDWHMSTIGDKCGPVGEASYGMFQIKNAYCNGNGAWGGYPYSSQDSALNADFYAAYLRSCLDNDFYDGGSWLYGGQTIAQIVAARGLDYAVWGCVGSWFSGNWYDSGARNYISQVQTWLANKTWLKY
jgi:Bacterial Ig domain/Chitobiase/beta-hexosaminidase C-terminal domain/Transglycosylase SLT domain